MTDHNYKWELSEIAQGLNEIARAIGSASKKEPVFILVPSDFKPEQLKEFAETLREALR